MKNLKRRLIVMLLSLAMLVTYMPVFAFAAGEDQSDDQTVEQTVENSDAEAEEEAPEADAEDADADAPEADPEVGDPAPAVDDASDDEAIPANLKFRMRVSSESKSGTGSVTGTVYDDFDADLVFGTADINRSNATVEFWMQNVASLNVGKLRSYKQTINTGITGDDTPIASVQALFKPFAQKSTIKAIVNGKETTVYTVQMKADGNVYADADENVRAAWHAIVNDENIEAGTKTDDDSYIVIKNGSWMQIGTQKLEFEKTDDLKLDDFNNVEGINTAIRNAVKLAAAEKADKIEIHLEPGTELAMSTSYAKLKEEVLITIDIADYDEAELQSVLAQLQAANNLSDMIKVGLGAMGTVFGKMGGKETVVTIDFGEQEEPEVKDDYKFRMKVSSEDSTGAVGSVTGTVHEDFKADLKFDGTKVNRSNATVDFWMQNVASLGVSSERHYNQTIKTGLEGEDNDLASVQALFKPFQTESTIKAIVNGEQTTVYTVQMKEDGNVYATPDDNTRTVWHTIVNDENIEAGTKDDEDSYIVIANGSWMQIGTKKLQFTGDDDLKLDNFNKLDAMNKTIRDAVELATEEKVDKIEMYLEPGTELAMGSSYAKLLDDAKFTIDIADFDEAQLEAVLLQLQNSNNTSDLIKNGLAAIGSVVSSMGGKETVVTIDFGHKYGEPEWTWADDNKSATAVFACDNNPKHNESVEAKVTEETTDATCEEAGKTVYTATATFDGKEYTDTKEVEIEAIGHDWDEPVWTWADDNSSATVSRTCKNDSKHVETVEAKVTKEVTKEAGCEEAGATTYTATATFEGEEAPVTDTKVETVPAKGHKYGEPTWTWSDDKTTATATFTCENDETHKVVVEATPVAETTEATCEEAGKTVYTAKVTFNDKEYTDTKEEEIPATGHDWSEPVWNWTYDDNGAPTSATATFTCKNCGAEKTVNADIENKGGDDYEATVEGPDGETYTDTISSGELLRIAGKNRYATAYKNADKLKETLGVDKFDAVVLATGENFPDALSGAYLATVNNAPLLLTNEKNAEATLAYIKENLKDGGEVIVLGGTAAVKNDWIKGLTNVDRLAGTNRYDTNRLVLQKLGYTGGDILVATGRDFPDSLSGSALQMPILLVEGQGTLTNVQKAFLGGLRTDANEYIAGGTAAVSTSMENALKAYGTVAKRFAGSNRYETSKLIAEEFFGTATLAVLSVGHNYPDGLSAGPLAASLNAPILLANNDTAQKARSKFASEFTHSHGIEDGIIIGGTDEAADMISDSTAKAILSDKNIVLYEPDMYE